MRHTNFNDCFLTELAVALGNLQGLVEVTYTVDLIDICWLLTYYYRQCIQRLTDQRDNGGHRSVCKHTHLTT